MRTPAPRRSFLLLRTLLAATTFAAGLAVAAPVYDERADAHDQVEKALAQARATHRDVLVLFGANWCPDCRVIDEVLHSAEGASIAERFVLVKVNVGSFDRNLDIARRFDASLAAGLPVVALVDADAHSRYVTRGGELVEAGHMGAKALLAFFQNLPPADGAGAH